MDDKRGEQGLREKFYELLGKEYRHVLGPQTVETALEQQRDLVVGDRDRVWIERAKCSELEGLRD